MMITRFNAAFLKFNNMIRLNCFFKGADVASCQEALQAAIALTEKSQLHAGCIAYDVFPSATRNDVFMICETWADQASLDAHSATPEFAHYVEIIHSKGEMKLERFLF